jgi:hypothetical protein
MALSINIPDSANNEVRVALGGLDYTFSYSFNTRDQRYRLDILQRGTAIIRGLKLMESALITSKYDLPLFDHGQLAVVRLERTSFDAGRNNMGFGKAYALIYFSNEELEQ